MRLVFERAAEISAALLLCAAICLGGGSQDNAASLAVTELLALPALGLGVARIARFWAKDLALPLASLTGLVAVPLMQLIPLPPDVWTRLPGRAGVVAVLQAAQVPLPRLPLSLTPETTAHCVLALLPPAALFLIVRSLGQPARARMALLVVGLALASILLGLLQVAQGPAGGLRFYRVSSYDTAVGFFANRDHLADFLACAVALSAGALLSLDHPGSRLAVWAARGVFLVIPILIMGIAVTASRAGVFLGVIGLVASVMVSRAMGRRAGWAALGLATTVGGVILIAALTDRLPALARFANASPDLRFTMIPYVLQAIKIYWPLGSGVGSFVPIFQTVQPTALVGPYYVNHAFDEFLEATLESGVMAWLILVPFLIWWTRRGIVAWRRGSGGAARLAQVGFVVVGMILLHALVDFPLRTVAMTSVLALACALMTEAPSAGATSSRA
jgi:hypothetical protein